MPDAAPFVSYSLFAQDQEGGLCCAVRQDQAVPGFVAGWMFKGVIAQAGDAPPDFKPQAAQAATALTGFYLFHSLRTARMRLPDSAAA
ncbi:hypothetical protein [Methylobacterium soli]|uniref:Uncharacterized protein n=1 Tax=Methylobacterium soli TaxID=553447 RepID=A0A6L3SYH0_9HYPH|nr:hypothetical protein [Methylobacterium soli]KAB1077274.1 hypothetical protein F6X53_19475 [Methylobacterium soli]GJE41234.1 hypothetical protein AEGHOMDF_0396 [Methylobacterium soli]